MITARELVFYIRAEDQASRVVRRAAKNIGSLANIKNLQGAAVANQLAWTQKISDARNAVAAQELTNINKISAAEEKLYHLRQTNNTRVAEAQQAIRRNATAITDAQVAATRSRASYLATAGSIGVNPNTIKAAKAAWQADLETIATLNRQTEILTANLAEVERVSKASAVAMQRDLAAVEEAAIGASAALRAAQTEVTRLAIEAAAADAKLITEAQIQRATNYINALQGVARTARLVGVVVGGSLAVAAHAAANFSSEVALAASQKRPPGAPATATLEISKQLQNQILPLMQRFPASAKEMSDSFYQIFSGTNIQSVKEATKLVELFNKAAVGGGASLDEMTQAGISIKNIFGVGKGVGNEFQNMTQAMNVFFSAVRYGRMTAAQFASTLGYITPIAKDVHLSFKNIAQDMAFFTRQTGGNLTRQDAQGLARLIQLMSRQDFVAGMAKKGIPVFDKLTGAMRPVVSIIKDIHDKLKLTPQETVNFFKDITALGSGKAGTQGTIQAIRILAQGLAKTKAYGQVTKQVTMDNHEFERSFQALSKTPGVQWKVFLNQLKALAIIIGTDAIPAFVSLGKYVHNIIVWFNSLSDSTKHTLATWGVYGSVIAVFGGTLLIAAGSVAKFMLAIRLLRLESLGSEVGLVRGRFAIWMAVLVTLVYVLQKYPGILRKITAVLGGLKGILIAIATAIAAISFLKFAGSMGILESSAIGATTKVDALRLSLLKLSLIAIPAIVIPIAIKNAAGLGQSKPGQPHVHYSSNPLVGLLQRVNFGVSYELDKVFGASAKQARADALGQGGGFRGSIFRVNGLGGINNRPIRVTQTPKKVLNALAGIGNSPWTTPYIMNQAYEAYNKGDYKTVFDLYSAMVNQPWKQYGKNYAKAQNAATQITNSVVTAFSGAKGRADAETAKIDKWNKLWENVIRLDKIASAKPSIKNNTALMNAEDALQAASQGNQYSAAMQYLSTIEQAWKKTDIVDIGSQRTLNKRIDAVIRLNKAYQASPTLANHKAYYTALTKLNKDYASQASQDYINDYVNRVMNSDNVMDIGSQKALKRRIDAVIKLDKIYQKTPSIKNHQAYFNALQALNRDYASEASQDYINDYINRVMSADNKAFNNHKKLMKQNIANAKEAVKSLTQGIQSMYDTLLDQEKTNYGELFQGPFMTGPRQSYIQGLGFKPRGVDLLKDINAQNFAYGRLNKQIDTLGKRGAPKAFTDALRAAGVGAKDDIQALTELTPQQFKAYVRAWNRGQNMQKANAMKQLNTQLAVYESYGKKIARAIITGVQSEDQNMQNVLQNLIIKMFPGLAKQGRLLPTRTKPAITLPEHIGGTYKGWHKVLHSGQGGDRKLQSATLGKKPTTGGTSYEDQYNTAMWWDMPKGKRPHLRGAAWQDAAWKKHSEKQLSVVAAMYRKYPFLQKYAGDFAFKQTGPSKKGYMSESYQRGEPGSFNPKKLAVLLYGHKNNANDVAGEVVSHFLAKGVSPTITKLYNRFARSITPAEMKWMRRDYKMNHDKRPFKQYEQQTGIPALFRGLLFHQLWPNEVKYTKHQKAIFGSVEKILKENRDEKNRTKRTTQSATQTRTNEYHFHAHGEPTGKTMTDLRHMSFRVRNGILT